MVERIAEIGINHIEVEKTKSRPDGKVIFEGTVGLRIDFIALKKDDHARQPMELLIPFRTIGLDEAVRYALDVAANFGKSLAEAASEFLRELEDSPKADPEDQT